MKRVGRSISLQNFLHQNGENENPSRVPECRGKSECLCPGLSLSSYVTMAMDRWFHPLPSSSPAQWRWVVTNVKSLAPGSVLIDVL